MTATPLRDDPVTTQPRCPGCGTVLDEVRGRQRYCTAACRQRAYRQRQPHPEDLAATSAKSVRASGVYQCPDCDSRYVGQQRCPDCNIFCARIGTGGTCPCCDEPITLDELLQGLPS